MGTPIQKLGETSGNTLFMKREDLIPFSFGGNKARKAEYFFKEIDEGGYDCVVTYGSSSSNHCRIVSNLAAGRGLPCHIIGPEEASEPTFNSLMMELFGAEITVVPVSRVSFGFVAGGGEYGERGVGENYPFAGGAGAGVTLQPVGFLVCGEGGVRMLPAQAKNSVDRVIDLLPGLMEEVKALLSSARQEKQAAPAEEDQP